jgi:two-component system nitrate/nitrite response regulator NarP
MTPTTTILVADDHPIVLEGLVALFQGSGHTVIAKCTSGPEVFDALQRLKPDILLLDLNMPPPDGLEIARLLKQRGHSARIVLLTSHLHDEDIVAAMRLGINGIMLKETAAQQLIACLDAVCQGRQWFDPEVASRALNSALWQSPTPRAADQLTSRELDVARLVARGMRNKEVARQLSITEGTVKMYLHNIYEKLNLGSRVELANLAREQGLL